MGGRTVGGAAILIGAGLSVAIAGSPLSPNDIKTMFGTGRPFSAVTATGKSMSVTLRPNGSATAIAEGEKTGDSGTWRVSEKGYCSQWVGGREHCYTVEPNGNRFAVISTSGKLAAYWTLPRRALAKPIPDAAATLGKPAGDTTSVPPSGGGQRRP